MAGSSTDIKPSGSSTSFTQTTLRGVGYAAISIVTVVMLARVTLQFSRPRKVQAEDYCMAFAYVLFVTQCVLYIIISPIRDRVQDFTDGKAPLYPELAHDGFLVGRLIFPALIFFRLILWTVKFGLLLLYRKLITGLPGLYTKIWWFLVVFCSIVRITRKLLGFKYTTLTDIRSHSLAITLHSSRLATRSVASSRARDATTGPNSSPVSGTLMLLTPRPILCVCFPSIAILLTQH
jgi:hypothetical protein